jgi:S-adenosylmethionine/arginine decarboxylase-like enzyme
MSHKPFNKVERFLDRHAHLELHGQHNLTATPHKEAWPTPQQLKDSKHRGFHFLMDYNFPPVNDAKDSEALAHEVFGIMEKSLKDAGIHIVFEKLVILPEPGSNDPSPLGFTSVLLLDESHATAHCFSNLESKGLLAVDVFTCGGQPDKTLAAAKAIHSALDQKWTGQKAYKSVQSTAWRFPYDI